MIIHNAKELAMLTKTQRKKLNVNQTQLGDQVGLNQKTISTFENNPGATKLDTLFRILSAANLELRIRPKDAPPPTAWTEEW